MCADDQAVRLCPYCEGPIRRPKGKTCGDVACQAQHKREGARRAYLKRRAAGGPSRVGPREARACLWCGELFETFVNDGNSYCSHSCGNYGRAVHDPVTTRQKYSKAVVKYARTPRVSVLAPKRRQWWSCTCRTCGVRFINTTYSWSCSSECLRLLNREVASRIRHRRRARQWDEHAEVFARVEVFERDGYLCHLCGEMTDREAVYPDMAMPTIDHVIPVSKGGHHTRANCKTAHLMCNSLKGNREDYAGPWIDLRANDPFDRHDLSPVG